MDMNMDNGYALSNVYSFIFTAHVLKCLQSFLLYHN